MCCVSVTGFQYREKCRDRHTHAPCFIYIDYNCFKARKRNMGVSKKLGPETLQKCCCEKQNTNSILRIKTK